MVAIALHDHTVQHQDLANTPASDASVAARIPFMSSTFDLFHSHLH